MSEPYTPEELAAMREVAKAAAKWAPGSWEWGEMGHALWAEGDDGPILDVCSDDRKPVPAEAKHIATFDPPTVLRLLGEIQRMNGEPLAYQTRIESDAVRLAEKDAEIARLQKRPWLRRCNSALAEKDREIGLLSRRIDQLAGALESVHE